MRLQFDPSQEKTSTFVRRQREPSDVRYLSGLNFLNWTGGPLEHEKICSFGHWVISDEGDYILFATGGGSFEAPEMYEFKYRDQVIHLSSGGGGLRSHIFTKDENGIDSVQVFIDSFIVPKGLLSEKEKIASKIAEAFSVEYGACRLELIFDRSG